MSPMLSMRQVQICAALRELKKKKGEVPKADRAMKQARSARLALPESRGETIARGAFASSWAGYSADKT
ncbi:hypothetical protein D3C72_2183170 [compost metagenome]